MNLSRPTPGIVSFGIVSFGSVTRGIVILVWGMLGFAGLAPSPAAAQDAAAAPLLEAPLLEAKVADFFRALGDLNGTRRAFDELLEGGPAEDSDRIDKMVEQVEQMESRFGPARSVEQVATRTIGSDVYLSTHLAKTDQLPITWKFIFYRRPGPTSDETAWTVISVRFNTDSRQLENIGRETPATD